MKRKLFFLLVLFSVLLCACGEPQTETSDFFSMDTYCTVTAYQTPEVTESAVAICARTAARAEEIITSLSGSKTFFASKDGESVSIDSELAGLVSTAQEVSAFSGGKFDLTVAPLTRLWDVKNATEPPAGSDIQKLLPLVGYEKLALEGNSLTFAQNGMGVDFGAVGKGFEAKLLEQEFQKAGYKNVVVNLGGNITVIGDKNGKMFQIGIQSPDSGQILGTVRVASTSVVTSGDYERYFEYGGRRYHHLLDPDTGYPAWTGLSSVTVICSDPVLADALSTAFFVSGKENAKEIFDRVSADPESGLSGAVLVTDDKTVTVWGQTEFTLSNNEYQREET